VDSAYNNAPLDFISDNIVLRGGAGGREVFGNDGVPDVGVRYLFDLPFLLCRCTSVRRLCVNRDETTSRSIPFAFEDPFRIAMSTVKPLIRDGRNVTSCIVSKLMLLFLQVNSSGIPERSRFSFLNKYKSIY